MKHILKLAALAVLFILACAALISPQAATLATIGITLAAIVFTGFGVVQSLRGRLIDNTSSGLFLENLPKFHGTGRYKLDTAIADGTQLVVVKLGSDSEHVAVTAAASDKPIGVIYNEGGAAAAVGDWATVHFLGQQDHNLMAIASAAIAQFAGVYSDGAGGVMGAPTTAGTYWQMGESLVAAGASGDAMAFTSATPRRLTVIAKTTAPGTASASDLATAEALANAEKADSIAILAALANGGELKILQA